MQDGVAASGALAPAGAIPEPAGPIPKRGAARPSKRRPPRGQMISLASMAAGVVIALGAWRRDDLDLAADEGTGYALGIIGLGCMTLLLVYSLRKRVRAMRNLGRISSWFQVHMLLGLFGPVAILYHCGFRLGSTNSNVALLCALLVAGSGVIGRVIYTRIHHGLSDERTTLNEMRAHVEETRELLAASGGQDGFWTELDGLEERVNRPSAGAIDATGSYLMLGHRCRSARRAARRRIARLDRSSDSARQLRTAVNEYVHSIRRLGALAAQERFFSLWHVLHLPLCFLLFVTAIFHVLAVHMY